MKASTGINKAHEPEGKGRTRGKKDKEGWEDGGREGKQVDCTLSFGPQAQSLAVLSSCCT